MIFIEKSIPVLRCFAILTLPNLPFPSYLPKMKSFMKTYESELLFDDIVDIFDLIYFVQ